MKYFTSNTILSASALLLWARSVSADTPVSALVPQGCYSSVAGFKDVGPYTFQSSGYCQQQCAGQGYPVMALFNGQDCQCGHALPPESAKTSDSDCNVPCNGWPKETCGGENAYNVYLTGLEQSVPTLSATSTGASATGGSPTTGGATTIVTEAGQTIVVTASSQNDAQGSSSGSGSKTAGIAAGVVVGVVALGAIAGGAFFFFRRQKRKEVEEEYRRNAAINSFVHPNKPISSSSMSDSRWDGDYMAQRRQSNGSIADDEDFSRRILKVTNPDR